MSQIKPIREAHFTKAIILFKKVALYKATATIIAKIDIQEKMDLKTGTKYTDRVVEEIYKIEDSLPKIFLTGSILIPDTFDECLEYVRFPSAWAEQHKTN